MELYDVIIIGGGPAGYTAAIYTARGGLKTLVIEKLYAGGQMAEAAQIHNYPGFPQGVDGVTLALDMQKGAHSYGVRTVYGEVVSARLSGEVKTLSMESGEYQARAVIIATGAGHARLGLPREEALTGKGVAYCAACDGMFCRGKTAAVVGGGNSAVTDALHLSKLAKKVWLIHRRDTLRAERQGQEAIARAENVELVLSTHVTALLGGDRLTGVTLRDTISGEERNLEVDALFVSIGRQPETAWLDGQLDLDEKGYILADESTRTNLPGVFAAGDVRSKQVRQIVTATADGATAAYGAQRYLEGQ